MRCRNQFAVHPLHRFHAVGELWRIVLYQKYVALLAGCSQNRNHADIDLILLGSRHDRRHIAHIPEVVFLPQHFANDNGPLKTDLKLDVGTGRQILFPQLLAVDHNT